MQEIDFPYDSTSGTISLLRPFSDIVLQIRVRNTLYKSAASKQVSITTPEGTGWFDVADLLNVWMSIKRTDFGGELQKEPCYTIQDAHHL